MKCTYCKKEDDDLNMDDLCKKCENDDVVKCSECGYIGHMYHDRYCARCYEEIDS
jgi:hypothetical protein